MCELFTIAGTTVTVMQAAMAAAAVVGAVGAVQSGQAQAKAAEYNAQVAENNAQAQQQAAAYEESRLRERQRRELGYARAAAGGTGVSMEGSPLDLMAQNAQNAEMDALAVRYQGLLGANASRSQAAGDRLQGEIAQQSGYMKAGTSLLTAATSIGGSMFPAKTPTPSATSGIINTDIGYGPMRIAPRSAFGG